MAGGEVDGYRHGGSKKCMYLQRECLNDSHLGAQSGGVLFAVSIFTVTHAG